MTTTTTSDLENCPHRSGMATKEAAMIGHTCSHTLTLFLYFSLSLEHTQNENSHRLTGQQYWAAHTKSKAARIKQNILSCLDLCARPSSNLVLCFHNICIVYIESDEKNIFFCTVSLHLVWFVLSSLGCRRRCCCSISPFWSIRVCFTFIISI